MIAAVTFFFNDKTQLAFTYDRSKQPQDLARLLHEALVAKEVCIVAENDLFIISSENLKYVEITPKPEHLPVTTLHCGKCSVQRGQSP